MRRVTRALASVAATAQRSGSAGMAARVTARRAGLSAMAATMRRPGGLATQRRGFMSEAEFREHVPPAMQGVYTEAMAAATKPVTQRIKKGECHSVASYVRDLVQERREASGSPSAPSAPSTRVSSSQKWSARNERMVDLGYAAVVKGHGVEISHSEWAGHESSTGHAVAVLSRTTNGTDFLVHDPDTTHDPRVAGSTSPGANLRVMSSKALREIHPAEDDDVHGSRSEPVVEHRSPGVFSTVLGFMGFGGK
jgi:hypothetical protein